MAYYPLKVKDDQGNTHVVGDPRTSSKANTASPELTGTPTAPTAGVGTNTTQVATTAFVNAEIANDAVVKALISGSKGALITSTGSAVDDLTVGTDGHVLTADSNETLGIKWAAPSGGGGLDPFLLMGA